VIATSNAGSEYIRELVGNGKKGEELQKLVINHILQAGFFAPEFLNRFDGVVVYEPLSQEQMISIALLELSYLAENLKKNKNLFLEITNELCEKVAKDGYSLEFGARPIIRVIDMAIGDLIAKGLLTNEIEEGDTIKIIPGQKKEEYFLEKVS
jgi:ATP-dependent Clp protease ATP-binding subunit ClpA